MLAIWYLYTATMNIDSTDLAWVAGLLEGEGSFTYQGIGTKRNIAVLCHMTDRDVLERLQQKLGVGRLYGPYRNGKPDQGWKPRYMYSARGKFAYDIMKAILPLMCARRSARIRELLTGYDSVESKVYKFEHIESGRIETTTDKNAWLASHGVSEVGIWRTMVGQRKACRGWRRLQ